MNIVSYYDTLAANNLSFAAIFLCIGIGFFFITQVAKQEKGPGFWAISFILNSIGFVFWSGIIPLLAWQYYLLGEISHICGFLFLVFGVYRFTDHKIEIWNFFALGVFILLWSIAILLLPFHRIISVISVRLLRSSLFLFAGTLILYKIPKNEVLGRRLAGISLILWGVYVVIYGFIKIDRFNNFIFGLLVGFQVLAAFGMIVMIVNKICIRLEEKEKKIIQLEKILPICAYCKKIRDKDNNWHSLESYIEDKTNSQLSHGICPDCLVKHFPKYALRKKS